MIYLKCLLLSLTLAQAPSGREFDARKEDSVRKIIYGAKLRIYPVPGSLDEAVEIPDELVRIYSAHPDEVTDVLLRIMDGAQPQHSIAAASYAMSLIHGPDIGVVCVKFFEADKFDTVDRDWAVTPRQHWIRKVNAARKMPTKNR